MSKKSEEIVLEEGDEDEEEEVDLEDEDGDEEDEDGEYMFDIGALLTQTLATPEGDTLCSVLKQLSTHMETQNKILIKIAASLLKK
jgi:hypothetical protein